MSEHTNKLTDEQVDALWIAYKNSDDSEAKDALLLHYSYLVRWIVRRMMPKYNDYAEFDDLMSCGTLGLITAINKFNTEQGVKFETYAVTRIRGEILDYMRAMDWAPASLRKKINQVTATYEELERENPNRTVDDSEVAEKLDMTVDQLYKILDKSHMFNVVNFEAMVTPDGNAAGDVKDDAPTPEDELIEKEIKRLLAEAIDSMKEQERLVITLYYYEGLLLKEIADIVGVTESRVSQIHSKALGRLRVKLQEVVLS